MCTHVVPLIFPYLRITLVFKSFALRQGHSRHPFHFAFTAIGAHDAISMVICCSAFNIFLQKFQVGHTTSFAITAQLPAEIQQLYICCKWPRFSFSFFGCCFCSTFIALLCKSIPPGGNNAVTLGNHGGESKRVECRVQSPVSIHHECPSNVSTTCSIMCTQQRKRKHGGGSLFLDIIQSTGFEI